MKALRPARRSDASDASLFKVASYRIVPERSILRIEGRSSLHPIRVEVSGLTGTIEAAIADSRLDAAAAPRARVEIDAELLKPGKVLYDRELERRLEIRKFPRIIGQVTEVERCDSPNLYRLRGNLSLHGVTRAVYGEVVVNVVEGGALQIEGEHVFDMRSFGLEPPKFLMLRVYPEVTVRGRVFARPQN